MYVHYITHSVSRTVNAVIWISTVNLHCNPTVCTRVVWQQLPTHCFPHCFFLQCSDTAGWTTEWASRL